MKKSDIYEIMIKILGVFFFISLTESVRNIITYIVMLTEIKHEAPAYEHSTIMPFLITNSVYFVLLLGFSLLLIFRNRNIVKLICTPSDYVEEARLFASPKVIYEVVITLTGLMLILWTLPDLAVKLKGYIVSQQTAGWHASSFDTGFLIAAVIKIIIGLFAIALAKGLSNYLGGRIKHENKSDLS